jgi:hypothetical protein
MPRSDLSKKSVANMTDDELTRYEFSMWMYQVSRRKDDPPEKRDKDLCGRWGKVAIRKLKPDDYELKIIAEWAGVDLNTVKKYSDGIDPIPLDDY